MSKNKTYWAIFILVVLLFGGIFALMGIFYDNNRSQIPGNEAKNTNKVDDSDVKDDYGGGVYDESDIEKMKNIDLKNTDVDFEFDSDELRGEDVDLSSLDNENLNLSSVDSEVY